MNTTLNMIDPRKQLTKRVHEKRRKDVFFVMKMMRGITGEPPRMWGDYIIGFGQNHYKHPSGREGDLFHVGFSRRKTSLTLYILSGFSTHTELLNRLGKHKTGVYCLIISILDYINEDILTELITDSVIHMKQKYPRN